MKRSSLVATGFALLLVQGCVRIGYDAFTDDGQSSEMGGSTLDSSSSGSVAIGGRAGTTTVLTSSTPSLGGTASVVGAGGANSAAIGGASLNPLGAGGTASGTANSAAVGGSISALTTSGMTAIGTGGNVSSSGGAPTTGNPASGGNVSITGGAGANGGTATVGGAVGSTPLATGGAVWGSGGAPATGSAANLGGTQTAAGGIAAGGVAAATGGSLAVGTGGSPVTGGASAAVGGGLSATGGSNGSGGAGINCDAPVDLFPTPVRDSTTLFPSSEDGVSFLSPADDAFMNVAFKYGFTFSFYGVTYSSIYLNTNGGLTFGAGDSKWSTLEAAARAIPAIGVIWGDMNASDVLSSKRPNQMTYTQCADRFVVAYTEIQEGWVIEDYRNTATASLFPDGTILIQYGTVMSHALLVGVFSGTHASDVFAPVQSNYAGYLAMGSSVVLFDGNDETTPRPHNGELDNQTIRFTP
jgi:hypothetical protein